MKSIIDEGLVACFLGPSLQEARGSNGKRVLVSLQLMTSYRMLTNFKLQPPIVRKGNRFCIPGLACGSSEIMDGNGLDNCRDCTMCEAAWLSEASPAQPCPGRRKAGAAKSPTQTQPHPRAGARGSLLSLCLCCAPANCASYVCPA